MPIWNKLQRGYVDYQDRTSYQTESVPLAFVPANTWTPVSLPDHILEPLDVFVAGANTRSRQGASGVEILSPAILNNVQVTVHFL